MSIVSDSLGAAAHDGSLRLERTLMFNLTIHAIAMLTMATWLARTLPGGPTASDASRIVLIANHPWLFRLGWLPWQVTAWADLWLAIVLLRTQWIPKAPATFALLVTAVAIVPDQLSQCLWITRGVQLAIAAAAHPDRATHYLEFERLAFLATAGFGAIGYLTAAIGWSFCFALAKTWTRALTILSIVVWSTFAISAAFLFLPDSFKPNPLWIGGANAFGFVLLLIWLFMVLEQVARRSRPVELFGRQAIWRSPNGRRIENFVANSRTLRLFSACLPTPRMRSDVRDLLYVNYLVEADRLRPLVAPGLQLQTLGDNRLAMFTVLIYQHKHFGPAKSEWLRRRFGSPIQSNWRLYVTDPSSGLGGIQFVTTTISDAFVALATRLLSEGVPMHVPASSELRVEWSERPTVAVRLNPGDGSSPDFEANLAAVDRRELEGVWKECFPNLETFLDYAIPQKRVFSSQPWCNAVTTQAFTLEFPDRSVSVVEGNVRSQLTASIFGVDAVNPICFLMHGVRFELTGQTMRSRTQD